MRIARISVAGRVALARIEEDGKAVALHWESTHPSADALREALSAGINLAGNGEEVDDYRLLAPSRYPAKYFGVGLNYRDHAQEGGHDVPDRPTVFVKTPNTIVGPDDPIRYDAGVTDQVDFEVELVLVVGRRIGPNDRESATKCILGYTVGNDVTARDAQFSDGQWSRSKCFDTFGPLGPWIVTADSVDPLALTLWTELNGDRVQEGHTNDLVFAPDQILAYLARSITFEPGDLITTGTPAGVGFAHDPPRFLGHGDVVTVGIEGIGTVANPVVSIGAADAHR